MGMGLLSLQDHPRSRGEYEEAIKLGTNTTGSSPLSRGILDGVDASSGEVRIIPALAGNTASLRPPGVFHPDHPRSRGEYAFS